MRIILYVIILSALISCKDKEVLGENPYDGGKEAFGVAFSSELPTPEEAVAGQEVLFKIDGLEKWSDQVEFYINEQLAEITELTDSTVVVVVPDFVSSGGASVLISDQTFYGPELKIKGSVRIDPNNNFTPAFSLQLGQFSSVPQVQDHLKLSNAIFFVGSFSDYNTTATANEPITSIVKTDLTGSIDKASFKLAGKGFGSSSAISTISRTSSGQFLVSGSFAEYNSRKHVHNITRLNANGTLDDKVINVINPTPEDETKNTDTVPVFNGNVLGGIVTKHLLQNVDGEERIVAIGTFTEYFKYRYDARPTYDFKNRQRTEIRSLLRMLPDGDLDSTFNFDEHNGVGKSGPNGFVNDAVIYNNQIYMVGDFTNHNGTRANRIMRLQENGDVDPTFDTGLGANGNLFSITIKNDRVLVSGAFTSFNGSAHAGVVMLHLDGSIDESFGFKTFTGGIPTYAAQLENGKILVTGNFARYDGVQRGGFLLLEPDGTAKQAYNTAGGIVGRVMDIVEGTTSLGKYQLSLLGNISRFGSARVNGIAVLELD